jgi:hypothetical protein
MGCLTRVRVPSLPLRRLSCRRFEHDPKKQARTACTHCAEIGPQAVIAGHLHHRASLRGRRNAEPISRSLHDERRDGHRIELGETARCGRGARSARRLQRECEAEHSDGGRGLRTTAGDTGARGAQLACEQVVDHRRPRCIELMRGCGSTPTRYPVGLLDERDAQSHRVCDARHRNKIFRLQPTACAVTEDERGPRLICAVQVRVRRAERRADLERLHRDDAATSIQSGRSGTVNPCSRPSNAFAHLPSQPCGDLGRRTRDPPATCVISVGVRGFEPRASCPLRVCRRNGILEPKPDQ